MTTNKETAYQYRWVILGVLWAAYIVVFMQRLGMGPLAPFLKEEMELTSTQAGALMSAASFGYMLSAYPAGWMADRIGIRQLLLIGELVGGIFMMGMFFAPSYELALVFIAMSGLGCGCLFPTTTKGVMAWFPAKERATAMGVKQTGVNVGGIISAAVLPAVAVALGWRFGFLLLSILAIVIGIISFFLYKEPPVQTASYSKDSANYTDTVTLPMAQSIRELLKARDIWLAALAGFAIGLVEFAVVAHLVLYLTEALFYPVVTAGIILAVTQAGGIVAKPGGGFISDHFFGSNRRKVIMLWGGTTSAICILIALWGSSMSWALYPVLFILGAGAIGWGGVYLTLVAEIAGMELAGRAIGVVGVITMIGFILGPIFFGYVVDITGSYQPAWLSCAACAALCVIALLFVREEKRGAI